MSNYRVRLVLDENQDFVQNETLLLSFSELSDLLEEYGNIDLKSAAKLFKRELVEFDRGTIEILGLE